MGVVLSVFLGVIGLVVIGVLSSMAASKSHECKEAKKLEIWAAAGAFILAIIMFILAVFLL